MKTLNRKIVCEESSGERFDKSVASFNGKGQICIRNHADDSNDADELLILSRGETQALIELFEEMCRALGGLNPLPF